MRCYLWIKAVVVALLVAGAAQAAEPACSEPDSECFLKRVHPAGGWFPYGGGLLRWWNPQCFPCGGAPDDYCRKSLPCVCWPPYPPYFTWGPPETCCPNNGSRPVPK